MFIAQPIFVACLRWLRISATAPFWLAAALWASPSFSQTEPPLLPHGRSPTAATATGKLNVANQKQTGDATSGWAKLSHQQQTALRPLAGSWDSLNPAQQRKWLEVSRNFPSLSAENKSNIHNRMADWAALSNRERAEARLNFATTNELSQELTAVEKKAKWEAYQSLSAAEKKKLADLGSRPPSGAATATRPVAQKKLAALPAPVTASAKPPKMSVDFSVGSDNTPTSDQ